MWFGNVLSSLADVPLYIGARIDTTQQSGQTPDNEVAMNHVSFYVGGYNETDTKELLCITHTVEHNYISHSNLTN